MKINEVFEQAKKHHGSYTGDGGTEQFIINSGVKISKDKLTKLVKIYNTTMGGDYYSEISPNEYDYFCENGWLTGVYYIQTLNYKRKLESINYRIQDLNNKKTFSEKQYRQLKDSRTRYMMKMTKAIINLNKKQKQWQN